MDPGVTGVSILVFDSEARKGLDRSEIRLEEEDGVVVFGTGGGAILI
jgi:hypothetical protein